MRAAKLEIVLLILLAGPGAAEGGEIYGWIMGESRLFYDDPRWSQQSRNNYSFAAQPTYFHQWDNDSSFTATPFVRLDSADSKRTHFDMRELNYFLPTDDWELRVGVSRVFWGATEFAHLVDIINQTDLVENIDSEDKLGQPMVHLTVPRQWGILEGFVLPYFRERTFPGKKGRLRLPLPVDTSNAIYESGAGQKHVDFAVRYSNTIGPLDFGVYHFKGTGREPTLALGLDKSLRPFIVPVYEQIDQTGLDAQFVTGQWLWKFEGLHRTGQGDAFSAMAGGFEYTFSGAFDTNADVGVLGEYAFDDRGQDATTLLQNDIMYGIRIMPNDVATSHLLVGILQDVEDSSRVLTIEASRRIGKNWRLAIEARGFFDGPGNIIHQSFQQDDYLAIELFYFY